MDGGRGTHWWKWNPFKEVAGNTKPLFLAVYATVLLGIVFSSIYVVSSIYLAKPSSVDSFNVDHISEPSVDSVANKTLAGSGNDVLNRPIWSVPPAGTKMPSLGDFRLTKDMIGSRAMSNIIIVTFGNYAFMDFILNWVKHLTGLKIFNILVQWILNFWKLYTGRVFQFLIWEATWIHWMLGGVHQLFIKWEEKKLY